MKTQHTRISFLAGLTLFALTSLVAFNRPALAQATNAAPAPEAQTPAPPLAERVIAVMPWIYANGTPGAMKTTQETVNAALQKVGFTRVPDEGEAQVTAEKGTMAELPSAEEMFQVGAKRGVRYVMAGRSHWHTRPLWIFLAVRTKSTCWTDIRIVDVKTKQVVLDVRETKKESTSQPGLIQSLAAIAVGPIVNVSGGPKTPHEQQAARAAVLTALDSWLKAQSTPSDQASGGNELTSEVNYRHVNEAACPPVLQGLPYRT